MKRIRVPEFLAQAFNQSEAWMDLRNEMHDYRSFFMPLHIQRKLLEDVLKALSEHPKVPTDEQLDSLRRCFSRLGNRDRDLIINWQRRCFVQEEPEISTEIEDLLLGAGDKVAPPSRSWINEQISEAYRRGLRKGEQK